VIQSAGTGLACGSFFVVFAAGDVFGDGVELAVLAAGFCPHAPVSSTTVLKSSKILFIDPPELIVFLKSVPTMGKANAGPSRVKSSRFNPELNSGGNCSAWQLVSQR